MTSCCLIIAPCEERKRIPYLLWWLVQVILHVLFNPHNGPAERYLYIMLYWAFVSTPGGCLDQLQERKGQYINYHHCKLSSSTSHCKIITGSKLVIYYDIHVKYRNAYYSWLCLDKILRISLSQSSHQDWFYVKIQF